MGVGEITAFDYWNSAKDPTARAAGIKTEGPALVDGLTRSGMPQLSGRAENRASDDVTDSQRSNLAGLLKS